jgi:hypothetical protein
MKISDYLKLRLNTGDLDEQLVGHGLVILDRSIVDGMITVTAQKP